MVDCYVGMGGNFSNTLSVMQKVVARFIEAKEIDHVKVSRLYKTSPVSSIPQSDYLNAVCRFQTNFSLCGLLNWLGCLEKKMGKKNKPKDAPRLIDLDLLFYGSIETKKGKWVIPHPRWEERLFVLAPLEDVTDTLPIRGGISMKQIMEKFENPHKEKITIEKVQKYKEGEASLWWDLSA